MFHPEGELLTSDHPLLDYIRDHLERDGSLRVVEIWLPPNLENLKGIVAVPDVEFHPHPATTAATVSWRPVAITTWAVAYDTDERVNFPLSLAHDLRSAQPMPNLLRAVSLNGLRDGRPPNVALPALEPVLAAGRRLAEERVRSDLAILSGEIETRMQADRARIEHHLASELASLRPNDSEGRGRLESLSKKEIEDLALKYHCTARLSLHDIACVWLPDITWKVKISGRTRSCVSEEFHWSLDRGPIAPDCERCHAPTPTRLASPNSIFTAYAPVRADLAPYATKPVARYTLMHALSVENSFALIITSPVQAAKRPYARPIARRPTRDLASVLQALSAQLRKLPAGPGMARIGPA